MKITKKILILLLLCLLVILSSCTSPLDSVDICEKYISAVVEVQVRDDNDNVVGNATGTIISTDGYLITNRHVIRTYNYEKQEYEYRKNIFVRGYDEEDYSKVEIIGYSAEYDLAILKLNVLEKKISFELCHESLMYGEKVHTIGNGNGHGLAYSQGYIAAPKRVVKYEDAYINAIQVSMVINEGNSGGPLINDEGKLIGITTFRLRDNQNTIIYGTCFCIPIETICYFFEELNISI